MANGERYRGTLTLKTPSDDQSTFIVIKTKDGDLWLVFDGAVKTTLVIPPAKRAEFSQLINSAVAA